MSPWGRSLSGEPSIQQRALQSASHCHLDPGTVGAEPRCWAALPLFPMLEEGIPAVMGQVSVLSQLPAVEHLGGRQ